MTVTMEQISEGNFNCEKGSLDFSCSKVALVIPQESVFEGSFFINNVTPCYTTGTILTTDLRMECLTAEFVGNNAEIAYRFHGEKLSEGEEVKGEFHVISNQGEYILPFYVTVQPSVITSSAGKVLNLFHFSNLARENWEEALKIFYSSQFINVFQGNDGQYLPLYLGLSADNGNQQNMDEFLISNAKKQRLEYVTQEAELYLESSIGVEEVILNIVKKGWGYTKLRIHIEGEFLSSEKEVLTENEFIGNQCELPIYIDSSSLHSGKNYGTIMLQDANKELNIPVTVINKLGRGLIKSARLEKKKIIVQLMKLYQDYRFKKCSTEEWMKETENWIGQLAALDTRDATTKLFQSQLFITEERYREAQWMLNHARELIEKYENENPVVQAYYSYLTTLVDGDEAYTKQVANQVLQMHLEEPGEWRIAWILLFLAEEYNTDFNNFNIAEKWAFIEKQFHNGCSSPALYIEALILLEKNPTLLRKLDSYELQLLNYGNRQGILSDQVLGQFYYLMEREKEYSPLLFQILESCYWRRQDELALKQICIFLIKSGKTQPEFFEWYKRGVESKLRITNLYEYFMYSLDLNQEIEIPKIVLMYFYYQNYLDYIHSAYLYSYILKNKEQLPEIYSNFILKIEQFVLEQIMKEHIDKSLSYLYQEIVTESMVNNITAGPMSRLLFSHLLCTTQKEITKIVVYHQGSSDEQLYPVFNQQAWVPLYGEQYTLLFEDGNRTRYHENVEYTLVKTRIADNVIRKIGTLLEQNIPMDIYLQEYFNENYFTQNQNLNRWLRLLQAKQVDLEMKKDVSKKIIEYLEKNEEDGDIDLCLRSIPIQKLSGAAQGRIIRFLVLVGAYEKAYEYILQFGPMYCEHGVLVRLLSEMIMKMEYMYNEQLLRFAYYIFKENKYNGNILSYLCLHYHGLSQELANIWKAAESFEVDCYELSKHLLMQMLFTGSLVEESQNIFYYYKKNGGKQEVIEAYLAKCAFDYYIKEQAIDKSMIAEMCFLYQKQETIPMVCKLSFLRYFTENLSELTTEGSVLIQRILREMMEDGIHLNMFLAFPNMDSILLPMMDKTSVEYHAQNNTVAKMHYLRVGQKGEPEVYLTEHMKHVYGGVFFKEFNLFFGEILQYYIVEEMGEEEKLIENGTLKAGERLTIENSNQKKEMIKEKIYGRTGSRYRLINDIEQSKSLQDYATMDSKLEEYFYKEFLNSKLFGLI